MGINSIPFPSMFLEMYHFLKNDNVIIFTAIIPKLVEPSLISWMFNVLSQPHPNL